MLLYIYINHFIWKRLQQVLMAIKIKIKSDYLIGGGFNLQHGK